MLAKYAGTTLLFLLSHCAFAQNAGNLLKLTDRLDQMDADDRASVLEQATACIAQRNLDCARIHLIAAKKTALTREVAGEVAKVEALLRAEENVIKSEQRLAALRREQQEEEQRAQRRRAAEIDDDNSPPPSIGNAIAQTANAVFQDHNAFAARVNQQQREIFDRENARRQALAAAERRTYEQDAERREQARREERREQARNEERRALAAENARREAEAERQHALALRQQQQTVADNQVQERQRTETTRLANTRVSRPVQQASSDQGPTAIQNPNLPLYSYSISIGYTSWGNDSSKENALADLEVVRAKKVKLHLQIAVKSVLKSRGIPECHQMMNVRLTPWVCKGEDVYLITSHVPEH